MVSDPIGDMIVRIKNAGDAGKETVVFPYSRLKESVAHVLAKEGYLKSVSQKGKKQDKALEIELWNDNGSPRIRGVKRVSKLSRRIYTKAKDLKQYNFGFGRMILSTPKGILTEVEAKKENVGGEILFTIW